MARTLSNCGDTFDPDTLAAQRGRQQAIKAGTFPAASCSMS